MNIIKAYKEEIIGILNRIEAEESALLAGAGVMADAIMDGKVINVVGPGGHSNIPVEEVTWRAGMLAPMNGMLEPGVNLMLGAKRSNCFERLPGYAAAMFNAYDLGKTPGEVIIICNAYGINSLTIDSALEAKKRGMISIGITGESFCRAIPAGHPSRHPSGLSLCDIVDVYINSHMPYGDAVVEIDGVTAKMGPTSTYCNVFTINCLCMKAAELMAQRGFNPPVWTSANLPDGDRLNRSYEERYKGRIRHLW